MRLTCRDCGRTFPGGERGGHCTVCHESFSSNHLFDRHHVGAHEPGQRRCLTPVEMHERGWVQRGRGDWGGGGSFPTDKVRPS